MYLNIEIVALLVIQICVSAYVFYDSNRRDMNPFLWTAISIVAPIVFGLVIYLLVRKDIKT